MEVFSNSQFDEHEEIVFVSDPSVGLKAIIAVHSTRLGPSLGGCRMYPYSSEADALRDVLRLSRGMSYKAAMAEVALGGGKAVILGDPRREKTGDLLRAMGRAISRLNGRYITGEDMGTNPSDMCVIREETNAVSCIGKENGGYGDPAVFTALGALQAIRAGLEAAAGSVSLQGVRVAVQGVGNVGLHLCAMLAEEGVSLIVCDTHQENTKRAKPFGAKIVDPDEIYGADADVFAPCAIGGILNERTIPQLHARVVAGAANNQLARSQDAEALARSGIVYIPDYVANGGGLISCAAEWYRTDWDEIRPKVLGIYDTCRGILAEASRAGTTTSAAADRIAKLRMQEGPRPNSVCAIQ